ncbi:hypothetical protein DQ244_17205 [Blastococcus sp. TBT05-19]|uniref:hypothetical protein n=1 Tax=Blastococcus sp. TBT05-19 TaxID=2250581 RepID=UPI000DEA3359|nr:hypothetical protein [Blastococcus sp. TBT05-19]RBY87077.1 hypothetical protein DQ244_17205 [Blastococcus sp. TBT05-19]
MTLISRPLLAPAVTGAPAPVTRRSRPGDDLVLVRHRDHAAEATPDVADTGEDTALTGSDVGRLLGELLRRDEDRATALARVEVMGREILRDLAALRNQMSRWDVEDQA